jgi:hypothetical protein
VKSLPALIHELEQLIPQQEKIATAVSPVSVGWHISHSLMVLVTVGNTLIQSAPAAIPYKFRWKRVVIMAVGRIPRRSGKAPERVKPAEETITPEGLRNKLIETKAVLMNLEKAPAASNFVHPVFGPMQKKAGLRFMRIHTYHHLLIIRDIVKKAV